MSFLRRLLDPAYLYAIDPGPLGPWRGLYLAWIAALLAGAAWAWWRAKLIDARLKPGAPRADAPLAFRVAGWAFAFGLATLLLRVLAPLAGPLVPPYARYLALEVWTARVWPLSATVAGVVALGAGIMAKAFTTNGDVPGRSPSAPSAGQTLALPGGALLVRALAARLSPEDPPLPLWAQGMWAAVHLAGLALLWTLGGYAAWWAAPSLLALSLLPLAVRPRRFRPETLLPLLPTYLGALVTGLLGRLGIVVSDYQGFRFPDPWSPWFDLSALLVAGGGYVLWIQLRLLTSRWAPRARTRTLAALAGLLLVVWFGATVWIHRTHGVTASDPYSYVQMAIDLAETGSPLHAFPLAGTARMLGLPTWPAVHVGYHPPAVGIRSSTMWPIGWPLLMVPFYLLGGLQALYFAAPLVQALSLLVTWLLANEVLHDRPRRERWAVGVLTCLLLATSPEGTERMLVPMADAAAQLFTVLAMWLLLRAVRVGGTPRAGVALGAVAGAAFGAAYLIRHPQLPLGVAAVAVAGLLARGRTAKAVPTNGRLPGRSLALLGQRLPGWRRGMTLLLAFAGAALLVALPDLLYHRAVFGGWLHTESTEWFLISGRNVARSAFALLEGGVLRPEELGYLVPLLAVGAWRLWRRQRAALAVVGSGAVAVLAFHLFYEALRPRDLIPLFPVAYLCVAAGLWALWRWAARQRTLLAALCLLASAVLLGARSWETLAAPWRDDVITFGHVRAAQRAAFEDLRALTPADAVIGSMLNGGAIELHAGRGAVHPAPWREEELAVWVDALLAEGRPFYVLDDGEEMGPVLRTLVRWRLEGRYRLREVKTLNLPYFALGGGNLPRTAVLYRVEPGAR
jgi:hypothetical protein